VAEYRVDPKGFDILHQLLSQMLSVNDEMASRSMSSSRSNPITSSSRLGAALIMLGGGRRIEAMRTHGISQAFAYKNLHDVVTAINTHPALEIICDNSIYGLKATIFLSSKQILKSAGFF
jgi:hypothetical protein